MKWFKYCAFLLFFSVLASCQSQQKLTEKVPYFTSGRIDKIGNSAIKLISPGAVFAFQFSGDQVQIKMKNSPFQGYYNYVSVAIDGVYLGRYAIKNAQELPYTFQAKDSIKKSHWIEIYKATEAAMGEVVLNIADLNTIPVQLPVQKKIEWIGDSITCGFGNDESDLPCGEGQWFDQHNAYFAYGPVLSRKLNAQFLLSSVSGYGMYRNWNAEPGEEDTLPEVYDYLYLRKSEKAVFKDDYQPDLVSICLGTNDLSDGDGKKSRQPFSRTAYVKNYIQLVQKIYQKYPQTRVVLLNSPMVSGEKNLLLVECLKEVQQFFAKDENHRPIEIFQFTAVTPRGCGYHPSIEDHKQMASQLENTFKRLLYE